MSRLIAIGIARLRGALPEPFAWFFHLKEAFVASLVFHLEEATAVGLLFQLEEATAASLIFHLDEAIVEG